MNDYLLQSDVTTEGLFPSERTVQFRDNTGQSIMMTVTERKLVNRGGRTYIRVTLLRRDDGSSIVALPGEVYGSGGIVAVPSERLEPAAR
jgi:hypothetical protein